jgi:hypothetical protein
MHQRRSFLVVAAAVPLVTVAATLAVVAVPTATAAPRDPVVCVDLRADAASASRTAQECGRPVEVGNARSERGEAFANPDGTTTLVTSTEPQRVRRADGSWTDVDVTLVNAADGSLRPAATSVPTTFSGGGDGPLASLTVAGRTFTLSWPGTLPRPSVSGATATYAEVLPDVDLAVTATSTGFQHVLVVKNAAAASNPALRSIAFAVGGARAKQASEGVLEFVDDAGNTIAGTSAASFWDSSINPASAGEVLPSVTATDIEALRRNPPAELISTALRPGAAAASWPLKVGTDASGAVILTPDRAVLDDPTTVYPVFIDPAIGPSASKWAYANTINSNWDVGNMGWVGKNPYDGTLYRTFFDFPSTSGSLTWKGKHILSVSANIWIWHTWSCGDTPSYAFRTGGTITSANAGRMAWSTRPLGSGVTYLGSYSSHANKAGGCGVLQPDVMASFASSAFTNDVQAAANSNWDTYPFGICACTSSGSGESTTDRWKKYYTTSNTGGHAAPALSVTFNTVPSTPSSLQASGVSCGGSVGTSSPALSAVYGDADTADTLSATFEYRQVGSGTSTSVAGPSKPANNTGSVTVSLGSAAEGKSYEFRVRTNDGHDVSPWSGWCSFLVDALTPPAPNVSSSPYTSCAPANIGACVPAGGPGVSGTFTFSQPAGNPAGQDVTSYLYGWTSPPTASATVSAGSSFAVAITAPRFGLNTLYVQSRDPAGHTSPITAFNFLVNAPSAATALWPLDDIQSHGFTDINGSNALTTTGITWTPDARIMGASAATFGANADAATAGPLVNTLQSYSVSAWVRLTDTSNNPRAVFSQSGANGDAFVLYNTANAANWAFTVYDSDSTSSSATTVTVAATPNVWTHLAVAYLAPENQLRLYRNGTLVASTTRSGAEWNSTGAFHIGRARSGSGYMTTGVGDIGDVRVWSRVIGSEDLLGTDANAATGVPAVAGVLTPTEVGSWDFSGGVDCFCDSVVDGAYFGRLLRLDEGWADSPATSAFVNPGHDENDALWTDGVAGYATTAESGGTDHPVLRTDGALAVSAWVNMPSLPTANATIIRQGTSASSAVKLEYNASTQKWKFSMVNPDGSGGYVFKTATSDAVAATGQWVHLIGTFDPVSGTVKLYVNGVAQAAQGTGAVGFDSDGSLLIGANIDEQYYGGLIDQVKVFQGLFGDREAQNLYNAG